MRIFILTLFSMGLLIGCGDSQFGAGNDPSNPNNVPDLVDPFTGGDKPVAERVTYHCDRVVQNEFSNRRSSNYFVGSSTIGSGSAAYRNLLEIAGVCLKSGWTSQQYPGSYNAQYGLYLGTSSCSYWDQNMEITLGFESTSSERAGIQIKTTGDGFPAGWVGQGFPTENMQFDGYIDCTKEDLTINALAWNQNSGDYGYLTIIVPNEYGHKNHYALRATVYFQGSKLGTARLNIQ